MENSHKIKIALNKNSLLYKFIYFLLKPDYSLRGQKGFFKKLINSFRLYTFTYALIILLGIFLGIALTLAGFENKENAVAELVNSQSAWLVIVLVIITGPIIEELTFRLALRFSYLKASLNLGLLLGLVPSFFPDNFFSQLLPRILLSLLIFLTAYLILKRIKKEKIEAWYQKHFRILLYSTILIFGAVHISNYTNLQKIWFLIPLLIAPQILAGILFGYVRAVYGLLYSTILHIFHNMITIAPILILGMFSISLEKLENPSALSTQDTYYIAIIFIAILVIFLLSILINILNFADLFYISKTDNRSAFIPN